MSNENKIYTATDFAKYHAGTMPAKEMYALEKAALEDDFLADALEGYAFTQTEEEDLAIIKNTLASKNDIAKVIPIASKNNWMRYAAAAAIVLGLGTVFYNLNRSNASENNLAKNEVAANAPVDSFSNIQAEVSVVKADSVQVLGNISNQTKIITLDDVNSDFVATNPAINYKWDIPPMNLTPITTNRNFDLNSTKDNNGYNFNQLNNSSAQNNMDTKTGGPKQLWANTRNGNIANIGTLQANTNGLLNTIPAKPTSDGFATFKISADSINSGYLAKNDDREKDKDVRKVEEKKAEDSKLMEEVVTTSYGTKKAKQLTSATTNTNANALAGKVSSVQVTTNTTPAPKGRMDENKSLAKTFPLTDFNNYVQKNIKPVFDTKGNEIKGKVILSFKTNKKGQPSKIKVVQSLASKADDEAVALLNNAIVIWPANADRRTVEIVF